MLSNYSCVFSEDTASPINTAAGAKAIVSNYCCLTHLSLQTSKSNWVGAAAKSGREAAVQTWPGLKPDQNGLKLTEHVSERHAP